MNDSTDVYYDMTDLYDDMTDLYDDKPHCVFIKQC